MVRFFPRFDVRDKIPFERWVRRLAVVDWHGPEFAEDRIDRQFTTLLPSQVPNNELECRNQQHFQNVVFFVV
jgi:hypothetical protein